MKNTNETKADEKAISLVWRLYRLCPFIDENGNAIDPAEYYRTLKYIEKRIDRKNREEKP